MKAPDKIYIQTNAGETLSSKWTTIPFRDFENTEYLRKDMVVDAIKLAFGMVSMNPFDCSEAFMELLNNVGYDTRTI